ncbi:MAG: transposase, partial [Deltaproteobacteria bacterium]|nr:transposase [Deltaproteobacteria bacterium]
MPKYNCILKLIDSNKFEFYFQETMIQPETATPGSKTFFDMESGSLENILDQTHPLLIISKKIDWVTLITSCYKYYSKREGRPAIPIRLMIGILLLKFIFSLSDEQVVAQWEENIYYQAFTGQTSITKGKPC